MRELRVLHLASSIHGGAGIAAKRLNQSLVDLGVNSKILTLSPVDGDTQIQIRRNFFQLFMGKMYSFFAGLISNRTFFSIFSKNSLSIRDIRKHLPPEGGVIHIHNWFNLISEAFIYRLAEEGYKVVLTLHDERLLTGGCHYSLDCRKFEEDCRSCPEMPTGLQFLPKLVFSRNKTAITNLERPLELIAPSHWIAEEALRSGLLGKSNIRVIPNSLHDFAQKIDQIVSVRKLSGITKVIQLGVASMDPNSYIKGGDLIDAMSQDFEFNSQFRIILMADYSKENQDAFWGDIDFLLVASRIDNSPNVIHEAKSLGIPIIGTNVGGIPELLTSSDLLIEVSDLSKEFFLGIKDSLITTLQNREDLEAERDKFMQWSQESAKLHIKYYNQLVS